VKAACIVADAGPLIGLARIDQLALLRGLFSAVIVPQLVFNECVQAANKPGATAIRKAAEADWLNVRLSQAGVEFLRPANLGNVEVAAIALALELASMVLMDDKLARAFARRAGLTVIGTGGTLLAAKATGLIPSVRPALAELSSAGYYLSDNLVKRILELAGEAG
jgi:predicted nucleic acid-binding protein